MHIVTLPFEESLVLTIQGDTVKIYAFKTTEHGNIKFGIEAPRSVHVHREEIYLAIKSQQQNDVPHES